MKRNATVGTERPPPEAKVLNLNLLHGHPHAVGKLGDLLFEPLLGSSRIPRDKDVPPPVDGATSQAEPAIRETEIDKLVIDKTQPIAPAKVQEAFTLNEFLPWSALLQPCFLFDLCMDP